MLKLKFIFCKLLRFNFNKTSISSFRYNYGFNFKRCTNSRPFKVENLKAKVNFKSSMKYSPLWLGLFTFFSSKKEPKITAENLFARAVDAIENENLDEAILLLNKILSMLETQFDSEEITSLEYERKKARINSEMANVYMLLRDINKAADIIVETMRNCFQANVSQSHPMVIELSLKLALIYAEQGKYDDADIGFKFCVDNCLLEIARLGNDADEEEMKNVDSLLGMVYNYYSKFLYRISKYSPALETASKALIQAHKVYEKNHPNIINLINDQAVIYLAMKNYGQARVKFQEAIDICLACPKDDTVNILPSIYANFGLLYVEIGDPQNAEEMCTNGRRYLASIKDKGFVDESLKNQIADCFMRLAGLRSIDRED